MMESGWKCTPSPFFFHVPEKDMEITASVTRRSRIYEASKLKLLLALPRFEQKWKLSHNNYSLTLKDYPERWEII